LEKSTFPDKIETFYCHSWR